MSTRNRAAAPKPANWDAMCEAYRTGDADAIAREEAAYARQCAELRAADLEYVAEPYPD